jgi:hypothetical protein
MSDENFSLEERVRGVCHRLMLIQAAGNLDVDMAAMDGDALMAAVGEAAREALELLAPVSSAAAEVLNWREKDEA